MRTRSFSLLFCGWLAILAAPAPVLAQASVDITTTTCTAGASASGCALLPVTGMGTAAVQITGTWSGTITFGGSIKGGAFNNLACTSTAAGATAAETTVANGLFVCPVAGVAQLKVAFTSFVSGTARVDLQAAPGGGGSSGGASGSNAAASATGAGVPASADYIAYNNGGTLLGATGSAAGLAVDTEISTAGTLVDSAANPSLGALASYNMCFNGTTWDRCLKSSITEVTEDLAETVSAVGTYLFSVRRDTPASSAGTTGDNATVNTDSAGGLYVSPLATTAGGASTCYLTSAATTNATGCKAAAGQLYGVEVINTTSIIYYLRLYNLATAPTCSSATGFIRTVPIPHNAGNGAGIANFYAVGEAYATGIAFCLTGGGSSTDNTAAATGVYVTLHYK